MSPVPATPAPDETTEDFLGSSLGGMFTFSDQATDPFDDLFAAVDHVDSVGSRTWTPFPKQALAWELADKADETLFGGAAGPGKTEWLMEYGIAQMEDHPGNRGIIFRRVYPSLARSIIPRLKAKLPDYRARWNANDKTFTFPNGSVLECNSLQYLDDVYDYQGAEYGWIGWEEITEFAESQYQYMLGRLRAVSDGIHPHSTATSNPGGRGHVWVKRRFVKPAPDDLEPSADYPQHTEIWRPISEPGIHDVDNPPLTRVFVPATLDDNPALLQRDPGYRARLRANKDKGKRKAYEEGDWDAIDQVDGALWSNEDIEGGRMREDVFTHDVSILERVVAVDPSDGDVEGDGYGVSLCSRGMDGVGYVEEAHEWKGVSVATLARQTIKLYYRTGADAIVIEKNHGGKWLLEVFRQIDPYCNLVVVWASEGKHTRARPVSALFTQDTDRPEFPYRARIVGFHPQLEEELTTTIFDGKEDSPNRLDAMVWGLTHLMIRTKMVKRDEILDERLARR